MESRQMSIENMAATMLGTKHKKSLSVSSQSSFDSCSTYFTDEELDDFEEHEFDFNGVAVPTKKEKNESGIFLSAHARNILKRCAASDGNLLHPTAASARPSKLVRRGSLGTSSNTNANATFDTGGAAALIACLQTKSATAANPFLQQQQKSPLMVLQSILQSKGITFAARDSKSLNDNFWMPFNTDGYTMALTEAVRSKNLPAVRSLYEQDQHNLQCSNAFGESLVHIAARRGATDILRYMVDQAHVSIRVCCDNGRNPLHDACWTSSSSLSFDCIAFLLATCPDLFWLKDKRGHTPLQYVPRDSWAQWETFLWDHQHLLTTPQCFSA